MIRSLSPYYITIPWVSPLNDETATGVIIKIYVWNGYKNSIPENATYEVTRENATNSEDNFKLNIANWISDFITIQQQSNNVTDLIDGNNQYWVKWEVYHDTDDIALEETPSIEVVKLFSRGYNYGMSGENSEAEVGFLAPVIEYKVSPNSVVSIPYLIDESTVPLPSFILNSVTLDSGNIYEYDVTISDFEGNFALMYRQNGDTTWIESKRYYDYTDGNYQLLSNEITLTGDVDFVVGLYYPATDSYVYSNIITLTI